jgi:SPP1 gp7 family putative phage head morphogenesis protein
MPKVSEKRKRLARLMAADTSKYQHKVVIAIAKVGYRTMSRALSAYRASRYIAKDSILRELPQLVTAEFLKGKDELRDAMVLAHLAGVRRSRLSATMSLSVAGKEAKKLNEKLQIPAAELKKQQELYDDLSYKILQKESAGLNNKVETALQDIFNKGLHLKGGRKELIEAFDKSGITPDSTFQIEATYRTYTQMAYSSARWQTNQLEAIQEILWGYKYSTVGDMRVRPSHAALDGTKLPKDHQFWIENWTPNGWCCRCQCLEIFDKGEIQEPPKQIIINDKIIIPGADKGWNFNPGIVMPRVA